MGWGSLSWYVVLVHFSVRIIEQLEQAKDCLQLLHLWLTKRELETRRVKNRDFSGVDVNELDLIPTWGSD